MGIHGREKTLDHIARLCRAERRVPDSDIAAVRKDLEAQLGGTVPRSAAARYLAVSHTALNKWVASGDVPIVITKQGRREVPIPALLDLCERVAEERRLGKRKLHVLEPAMVEGRQQAARMRPRARVLPSGEDLDAHRRAELRSLAYHRVLAPRLRRPVITRAQQKLRRWEKEGRIDPRYARVWEEVFELSMPELRKAITADDEHGRDLRQNSPLGGLLSEPERRKILADI